MLKVPKVKNALFGLPLDMGTKIIGFLHLVLYAIFFIVILVKERTPEEEYEHLPNPPSNANTTNSSTTGNETAPDNATDIYSTLEDELIHKSFIELSASYFNDFALLVQITFAAFLLLGVYQKNLDYIVSWILLQVANVTFSLFFVIVYFVAVFRVYGAGYIQYLICEEITVTLVVGYCIIVVNSYIEELTKTNTDREEQMSPIVINAPDSPTINNRTRR